MDGIKINDRIAKEYRQAGYWTDATLGSCWANSVAKFGGREFVADDRGARCTYSQLDIRANALANYLEALGICAGDIVTVQITPRSEFVIALIACIKIGAVPAPLGLCFVEEELLGLLKKLNSRLHIATSDYHGEDRAKMLLSLKPRLEQLDSLIFVGENSRELAEKYYFAGSFESIMEAGGAPKAASPAKSDDVALILCTSGTTQGSKAVVFTHNNIIFSERTFNEYYGLTENDSIFMPAPLNHATGLHHGIISPMLRGGRLVLQEKFYCRDAIDLMNREKCSYSMGATPFIYDILKQLEASGEKLPSLKFYICGGAPVPPELVRRAYEKHDILVCESYGSTESVPHVGVKPTECLENAGNWSGKALPGIEVRIVDKNHKPLPPGNEGEEASRGPNLFIGYLGAPELTAEALDEDGWFYSGDLAVADEKGNIRIVGRIKDIIIRGGENLNSNHINDNLEGCPGVSDHAVIGMPDERLGERICAFIVPENSEKPVTKDEITTYLQAKKIHKRHWPEAVEIIDAIPRTESGKVKKNLLSDELKRRMKGGA